MNINHQPPVLATQRQDLIDRVVQLRRGVAGATTDNARLLRELLRIKRANQLLEQELEEKQSGQLSQPTEPSRSSY